MPSTVISSLIKSGLTITCIAVVLLILSPASAADNKIINAYMLDEETGGFYESHIVLSEDKILAVKNGFSKNFTALQLNALVLPGFIDLHNHPRWNLMAPWSVDGSYVNRFDWRKRRKSDENAYRENLNRVKNCDVLLYAKALAAAGGAIIIQGQMATEDLKCYRDGPARFLEAEIAPGSITSSTFIYRPKDDYDSKQSYRKGLIELAATRKNILSSLENGRLAFVHLAEGRRTNRESRYEFRRLIDDGLLREGLIIIHATAIPPEKGPLLAKNHVGIVWSPESNTNLYDETLYAGKFAKAGVVVGLGADWTATGSKNMIREISAAYIKLASENLSKKEAAVIAIAMATQNNAALARLENLGEIKKGFDASLTFVRLPEGCRDVVCLLESHPAEDDVLLTLLSGKPVYGDIDLLRAWGVRAQRVKTDGCPPSVQKGIVLNNYALIEKDLTKVFPSKPSIVDCNSR